MNSRSQIFDYLHFNYGKLKQRDVGRMPIAPASTDMVKSSEEVHYRHTTWPHCHKERVSNLAKVTLSLMLHLEFKPKIHLQTAHLSPQFLAPASFSPFSATCLLSLSLLRSVNIIPLSSTLSPHFLSPLFIISFTPKSSLQPPCDSITFSSS